MPIVIPKDIPAYEVLTKENIFVMGSSRALTQDIRPIEIAILNLMPTKTVTETQLMRLLANTPLQVNVTLVRTASYNSSNVDRQYLDKFYVTFDDIKNKHFDGLIVTGAPVENLDFTDVKYWDELCCIMDFAEKMVTSTVFICWGAQAALHYYYGIKKKVLPEKLFGIFDNSAVVETEPLLRGLNDVFKIPHSRHTEIDEKALEEEKDLVVLAKGQECGISIAKSADNRKFFFFGHSEYDRDTLLKEYVRDVNKGLPIKKPKHYFINDVPPKAEFSWKSTGALLFNNWLNYYVYQVTPYDIGR